MLTPASAGGYRTTHLNLSPNQLAHQYATGGCSCSMYMRVPHPPSRRWNSSFLIFSFSSSSSEILLIPVRGSFFFLSSFPESFLCGSLFPISSLCLLHNCPTFNFFQTKTVQTTTYSFFFSCFFSLVILLLPFPCSFEFCSWSCFYIFYSRRLEQLLHIHSPKKRRTLIRLATTASHEDI